MNYSTELLKMLVICYVLSAMAGFISELIYESIKGVKSKSLSIILSLLTYILSCEKCFSFWLTLIMTGDLFVAALIALFIDIIKKLDKKWTKTEL